MNPNNSVTSFFLGRGILGGIPRNKNADEFSVLFNYRFSAYLRHPHTQGKKIGGAKMISAATDWMLVFLGYLLLSMVAVASAYILGWLIIGGFTWPFRRLPDSSPWHIKDEINGSLGFSLWAIIMGLALLQCLGVVQVGHVWIEAP